jgi:hypothetical protein
MRTEHFTTHARIEFGPLYNFLYASLNGSSVRLRRLNPEYESRQSESKRGSLHSRLPALDLRNWPDAGHFKALASRF